MPILIPTPILIQCRYLYLTDNSYVFYMNKLQKIRELFVKNALNIKVKG